MDIGKAVINWLVAALLVSAFLFPASAVQTPSSIQIGTFNLEFFTDLDRSTGGWCERHNHRGLEEIRELAAFIDSLDIEVLALQEVEDEAAMELLVSFLPQDKYGYLVIPQEVPETCQKVAVLYQREEAMLSYQGRIPLSLGRFGLRDGLVVYAKVLPNGFDFTLVVVHLKASFDSRSRGIRARQLALLGDWVEGYLTDPSNDRDLVLAGDFNEHLLTNRRALELLDHGEGLRVITEDVPDKDCTPPGRRWTDPIDHIVISPGVQEYMGEAMLDNFFLDPSLPDRYSYSDHCVLWGDFDPADLDPLSEP